MGKSPNSPDRWPSALKKMEEAVSELRANEPPIAIVTEACELRIGLVFMNSEDPSPDDAQPEK